MSESDSGTPMATLAATPSALLSGGGLSLLRKSVAVSWRAWLEHMGGLWGFILLVCGLACFLAGNWSDMSHAARLGVMQGGLAGFVLLGMMSRARKKKFSGLCLLGAGLMVGAFWIVFSQIFQTGANSWQLFALWAAGVLPWLLLNMSVPLWLLMLILGNMAVALWGVQDGANWHMGWSQRSVLLCMQLNSVLWLACVAVEWLAWQRRNGPLLRVVRRWNLAVLPFLLGWATLGACLWLLDRAFGDYSPDVHISLVSVLAAIVLAMVALYERITRRVGPFSLLALCGFPLLNCFLALMVDDGDAGLVLFLYCSANLGYTALVLHTLAALRHVPHAALKHAVAHRAESCENTDPHTIWKHRQKDRTRRTTRLVGQGVTHLLSGLGGLLSSVFLIAFAVYSFDGSSNHVGFALAMSVIFLGAGLACVRMGGPSVESGRFSFFRTLALSLSLCGWFFLMIGAWNYWESPLASMVIMPAAALLYIVQPQPVWRFLSMGSALTACLISLTWGASSSEPHTTLALGVLVACAVPLYVFAAWGKWRPAMLTPVREQAVLPCLYAGIGVLLIFLPLWGWLIMWLPALRSWWTDWSLILLGIPVMGLVIVLLSQSVGHYRLARRRKKLAGYAAVCSLGIVVIGLTLLYFLIHHIARSFLLVLFLPLLGHACRSRLLERVGLIILCGFLVLHYYSWDVSFLVKAQNMTVVGGVLLGVATVTALWRRKKRQHRVRQRSHAASPVPSSATPLWNQKLAWYGAAFLSLALTLGAFQYALQDREKILAQGDTVLLALAPVDPLSYVQGYYMALAYTLDSDLAKTLFKKESPTPLAPEGFAVLERTPDDPLPVLRLKNVRPDLPTTVLSGEYAVPYRLNSSGSPSLTLPSGFLMEESMAEVYEQARYGVFRCVPGVCILSGLADSFGQIIVKPRVPE